MHIKHNLFINSPAGNGAPKKYTKKSCTKNVLAKQTNKQTKIRKMREKSIGICSFHHFMGFSISVVVEALPTGGNMKHEKVSAFLFHLLSSSPLCPSSSILSSSSSSFFFS